MCFVNVFIGFAVIAILRTVSHRRAAEHAEKIVLSKTSIIIA